MPFSVHQTDASPPPSRFPHFFAVVTKNGLLKSFGSSRDGTKLAMLEQEARQWVSEYEFGDAKIRIDRDKVEKDARPDGLKVLDVTSRLKHFVRRHA